MTSFPTERGLCLCSMFLCPESHQFSLHSYVNFNFLLWLLLTPKEVLISFHTWHVRLWNCSLPYSSLIFLGRHLKLANVFTTFTLMCCYDRNYENWTLVFQSSRTLGAQHATEVCQWPKWKSTGGLLRVYCPAKWGQTWLTYTLSRKKQNKTIFISRYTKYTSIITFKLSKDYTDLYKL